MNAFINHFLFEFKTGIRNRQLLFMNYLFPLGIYLMLGFIFPQINPPFLETMIPAMVMFAILAIPALTTILHLAVVAALITVSAPLLFDAPLPPNMLNYVVVFLAATLACTGLAVLIGVISSTTRMTVLWSQLVFLPSMLLGGIMMPSSFLPESVARISTILPPAHAMNALNGLAMGVDTFVDPWWSVLILLVGGVLAFALAIYLFKWDQHDDTQRGHPLLALLAIAPYLAGLFFLP
jgi:ABC-2 type transport system permease protein